MLLYHVILCHIDHVIYYIMIDTTNVLIITIIMIILLMIIVLIIMIITHIHIKPQQHMIFVGRPRPSRTN